MKSVKGNCVEARLSDTQKDSGERVLFFRRCFQTTQWPAPRSSSLFQNLGLSLPQSQLHCGSLSDFYSHPAKAKSALAAKPWIYVVFRNLFKAHSFYAQVGLVFYPVTGILPFRGLLCMVGILTEVDFSPHTNQ